MKRFLEVLVGCIIISAGLYAYNFPSNLFIDGLVLILASGYISYWSSYMQSKGTNLATKEDIQAITKLSESIKKDLELVQDNKIGFQTLRRQSILTFYQTYSLWFNYLVHVGFKNANDEYNKLEDLKTECRNSFSQLELFVEEVSEFRSDYNFIMQAILTIQANYYLSKERLNSIRENAYLIPREVEDFDKLKSSELDRISSTQDAFLKKLRILLKGAIES